MTFVPSRIAAPSGCLAFAAALGVSALAHGSDSFPDRLWPLAAQPAVSSSFCEYRAGHLHAGIDIRCFGREGIPCVASGDGYVSRVRASSSGYGKALYIQLDSGETLVYAHMSEFAPVLEDTLYREQVLRGRYRVDFRPRRDRYRVSRGDTIGYSGRTGTVAPHLHFEVRNQQEHPLDPFSQGFAVEDNLRPVFGNVLFVPLDIDGGAPFELKAQKLSDGRYTLCDTLNLTGTMGMSAQIVDFLNKDSGRLAPHRIELMVNGIAITDIALEEFSFPQGAEVDFVYDISRVRNRREYFFQLFERTGETLLHRTFERGGRLTPVPGVSPGALNEAVVTARDRAGNTSELRFMFRNEGHLQPPACLDRIVDWNTETGPSYFFEHFLGTNMGEVLLWSDVGQGATLQLAFRSWADGDEIPGQGPVQIAGVASGVEQDLLFPDLVSLRLSKRTLYGPAVFYALPWNGKSSDGNGELRLLNRPVQVGPYSLTLRADMTIRLHVDQPDTSAAIYRLNERNNKWAYYESAVEGDTVTTKAKRPGVYAVLADAEAPRVGTMRVATHKSYATGTVLPQIVMPILDEGSGVDVSRLEVTLAGEKIVARWEGDTEKLFVVIRDGNILGPQTITVEAFDRAGNRIFVEREVVIP